MAKKAKKKTATKKTVAKKDTTARNIGIGLTAAAVAAAGTYFFYGSSKAKQNRTKLKSWMMMAKAEVLEALEDAKTMTQEEYEELVEGVAGAYATLQTASKSDILEFKKEMKAHWTKLEKNPTVKKTAVKAKKVANKVVKRAAKAAKRVVKKATKKKTVKK